MKKILDVRPTCIDINLDNLLHNFKEIQKMVKDETRIMPVIKANAYGHGSVELGKLYKELGVKCVAVSLTSEAIELRKNGLEKLDILILNYTNYNQMLEVVTYDFTQSIYRYDDGKVLSEVAENMGKIVKVHIKIDTGLNRLGFQPTEESIEEILKLRELKNIEIEGIFTHFAKSDEVDKTYTKEQYEKFMWLVGELEKKGLKIPIKHVSNSGAIIDMPEFNLDMVRPGLILYGYYPSEDVNKDKIDLKPAMTLRSLVSNIKTVPRGTGISYGHIFKTSRESIIATVPVGYGDGYSKILTGKGQVYIGGKIAPVVGKICMDQLMVDITDIPEVEIYDEVILFGEGLEAYPSVEDIAEKLGTVNYEVISMMRKRIPRAYKKNGEIIKIVD